jgi:hypothetical protein
VLKGQDQQSKIRSTDVSTVWGYSQDRNWGYVAGAALIVGAGLLVAGTIVEDVATGGVGVADDPASFAAAGAMATAGAAAF